MYLESQFMKKIKQISKGIIQTSQEKRLYNQLMLNQMFISSEKSEIHLSDNIMVNSRLYYNQQSCKHYINLTCLSCLHEDIPVIRLAGMFYLLS